MKYSRRDFLKFGCLSAAVLTGTSLLGCSSQPSSSSSNNTNNANDSSSSSSSSSSNGSNASGGSQPDKKDDMNTSTNGSQGIAVVYFSCTGNTEHVADKIAEATDGVLLRLDPVQPYTQADLDYNSRCRANDEQNSGSARPEIAGDIPNVSMYDTIYLGYPIWWSKAPRIIFTFLESVNLAGKTVVPFCTSGSSPISGSLAELRTAAPDANWIEGRRFSAAVPQQEIDAWVDSIRS